MYTTYPYLCIFWFFELVFFILTLQRNPELRWYSQGMPRGPQPSAGFDRREQRPERSKSHQKARPLFSLKEILLRNSETVHLCGIFFGCWQNLNLRAWLVDCAYDCFPISRQISEKNYGKRLFHFVLVFMFKLLEWCLTACPSLLILWPYEIYWQGGSGTVVKWSSAWLK